MIRAKNIKKVGRKPILNKGTHDKLIGALLGIPLRTFQDWRDSSSRSSLYWALKAIPEKKLQEYIDEGAKFKEEFESLKQSRLSPEKERG